MFCYIVCSKDGTPERHIIVYAEIEKFATAATARGKKPYLVPAILNDSTPGPYQVKTGPVYDIDAGTITYGLADLPDADVAADIQARFSSAIQDRLDAFARTRLYDGILSACSYHGSTDPAFAAEGARCVDLRDATWRAAWTILGEVHAGARPVPPLDDLFAELPALTWPDEEGGP